MLVSTHYMDEAERCHEIAYIAYGELIARGTADEVIDAVAACHLRCAQGPGADRLARELRDAAGRRHGRAVRRDAARQRPRPRARSKPRSSPTAAIRDRWTEAEPTLEDVFIHLMGQARDNALEA